MKDHRTKWASVGGAVAATAAVMVSGCTALCTRVIHSEPFAGVKTDYAMCFHREGISPECRINPAFAIVDAPFSLVADVCFFPFEIGHHDGHSLWNPPVVKQDQETTKTNIPNQAAHDTARKLADLVANVRPLI